MKVTSLDDVLHDQLKDIYSAENQLVKALPKMAKTASDESLKDAIESHLEETKKQVERLNQVGKALGVSLTGKKCVAMEGLIEEGKEAMEEDATEPMTDFAIIAAAQKVEHYEIASYGTARALAEHLGHDDVARLLQETLDEESAADEKLTEVAQNSVLPSADTAENEDEGDEEEGRRPRRNGRKVQKSAR